MTKVKSSNSWLHHKGQQTRHYVQRAIVFIPKALSPKLIWRRITMGIRQLLVAIKFRVYEFLTKVLLYFKAHWLKISFGGFLLFMSLKKDVHFSVKVQSPLASTEVEQAAAAGTVQAQTAALKTPLMQELDDEHVSGYIERFSKVAQTESKKYGIPASVNLALALVTSQAGTSAEAVHANSHFGNAFAGMNFKSAWESWRYHSLWLKEKYPQLLEADLDRDAWTKKLCQVHFQNASSMEMLLRQLIEKNDLSRWDD